MTLNFSIMFPHSPVTSGTNCYERAVTFISMTGFNSKRKLSQKMLNKGRKNQFSVKETLPFFKVYVDIALKVNDKRKEIKLCDTHDFFIVKKTAANSNKKRFF